MRRNFTVPSATWDSWPTGRVVYVGGIVRLATGTLPSGETGQMAGVMRVLGE
ncbi:MAG TPA: hypothetical protein QGF58_12430 [Myxococcota bacterium]|nr:hypothetical protein [Myxococcota bacterium]